MTIGERVKKARLRAGLTQKELARAAGIKQPTISGLESGESRSTSHLVKIAKACRVRAEWLETGEGEMEAPGSTHAALGKAMPHLSGMGEVLAYPLKRKRNDAKLELHETELVEGDEPLRPDEIDVPYFREVEMAAGDGRTQVIENHGASMRFSLAKLSRAGVQPENAACATVSGTSMEPVIMDGSPVAIDKGSRHIKDGDIYALDHDGLLRVKRLYRLPLNRVRLVSENSEEFPEEVYSLGDPDAPRVIGRVFWWETFA